MKTPNLAELLVQQAKETERLEIMRIAEQAEDFQAFKKALEERHNASK